MFSNLSVARKITGAIGASILAGLIVSAAFVWNQSRETRAYDEVINTHLEARRLAVQTQFVFKKQVQEWKDILLRGHDSANLEKYAGQFRNQEQAVQATVDSLRRMAPDSLSRVRAAAFAAAHKALGAEYDAALTAFRASGGKNQAAADSSVKGKDRGPVGILDSLATYLGDNAKRAVADAHASAVRTQSIVLSVALLVFIVVATVAIGIGRTLARRLVEVTGRIEQLQRDDLHSLSVAATGLAAGNLDVRVETRAKPVTVDSSDEIGRLAATLNGMIAATHHSGAAFETALCKLRAMIAETGRLIRASSEGKLKERGDATPFDGGFREVVEGFNATLDAVVGPIEEASSVLERVAARDLTVRMRGTYKGDHALIKESVNTVADNLDQTLREISGAADQVAAAAEQIADGSQTLAKNATDQAASLEEVSANLQELGSMSESNAASASHARDITGATRDGARAGVEQMKRLTDAMSKIRASADSTAKIVKTIDEIAFQTNLLALNAAVEAARAGEAGRGFAVVAEEVRALAIRSAEAAKQTSTLIEQAVRDAQQGADIGTQAFAQLGTIDVGVDQVNAVIEEIAAANAEQRTGVRQIAQAVERMNGVTQSAAANSEESAAAAEELSGQAVHVRALIKSFRLSGTDANDTSPVIRRTRDRLARDARRREELITF